MAVRLRQGRVSAAINTCEYCHQTTGQLEESIVKEMSKMESADDDEWAGKVQLGPVQDACRILARPLPYTGSALALYRSVLALY